MWYVVGVGLLVISLTTTREVLLDSGAAQSEVDFIFQIPLWANLLNALAIISGLLGAVTLLLRRRLTYVFLLVSLLALLGFNIDIILRGALVTFGTFETIMGWAQTLIAIALLTVAHQLRSDKNLY